MRRTTRFAVIVALCAAVGVAFADTDTGTLNVTATVLGKARIITIGDIAFGNYDPTDATATDANGSVTVRATKGLAYKVYIAADRTMTDGTDTLTYELYSDAARTSAWGSTNPTAESYTSTSNAPSAKTIYGRVAALQDVQAGSYTDTVVITLEW